MNSKQMTPEEEAVKAMDILERIGDPEPDYYAAAIAESLRRIKLSGISDKSLLWEKLKRGGYIDVKEIKNNPEVW